MISHSMPKQYVTILEQHMAHSNFITKYLCFCQMTRTDMLGEVTNQCGIGIHKPNM